MECNVHTGDCVTVPVQESTARLAIFGMVGCVVEVRHVSCVITAPPTMLSTFRFKKKPRRQKDSILLLYIIFIL